MLYSGITITKSEVGGVPLCIPNSTDFSNPAHSNAPLLQAIQLEVVTYVPQSVDMIDMNENTTTAVLCATCHVSNRATWFLFPGSSVCPPGWRREYHGYLATSLSSSSEYICLDYRLRRNVQWKGKVNGLHSAEVVCPESSAEWCSNYGSGVQLRCAICSK